MLAEFAAKQQVVPLAHMFSATITPLDARQLEAVAAAARAIDAGEADGEAFHRLIAFEGTLDAAAAMLARAIGGLDPEQAGMALAFAYVPFEVVDAFTVDALGGLTLKRLASAIDPRGALPPRTRLFVADNMRKQRTMRSLVAGTASIVTLHANALRTDRSSLAASDARKRLRRVAAAAASLHDSPSLMAEALRCCLADDWWNAQGLMRHVADRAGIAHRDTLEVPPALADLLLISVMPTCDTIDAVERLLWARRDAAGARAVG
jgi:hypothetical protein